MDRGHGNRLEPGRPNLAGDAPELCADDAAQRAGPGNPSGLEFVEILPFTPLNRNNLIGWIAARSDGAQYGNAVVYDFPKTRLVDGPQQIEARIDQNAQLSGQLTLWNQQGSHVIRGSLLVIPCGQALFTPSRSICRRRAAPCRSCGWWCWRCRTGWLTGQLLRRRWVRCSDRRRRRWPRRERRKRRQRLPRRARQSRRWMNALIAQASRDFADYQQLTSQGKLAEAGQKLDDLKRVLDQLNAHGK